MELEAELRGAAAWGALGGLVRDWLSACLSIRALPNRSANVNSTLAHAPVDGKHTAWSRVNSLAKAQAFPTFGAWKERNRN